MRKLSLARRENPDLWIWLASAWRQLQTLLSHIVILPSRHGLLLCFKMEEVLESDWMSAREPEVKSSGAGKSKDGGGAKTGQKRSRAPAGPSKAVAKPPSALADKAVVTALLKTCTVSPAEHHMTAL
jgi:hypothetical protein